METIRIVILNILQKSYYTKIGSFEERSLCLGYIHTYDYPKNTDTILFTCIIKKCLTFLAESKVIRANNWGERFILLTIGNRDADGGGDWGAAQCCRIILLGALKSGVDRRGIFRVQ